ncbi:hypothetical protein J1TS5_08320 [Paenibacillus macerans]|nr:hypothetical protein J1TS5_08320 [Paenibacillus macerans]
MCQVCQVCQVCDVAEMGRGAGGEGRVEWSGTSKGEKAEWDKQLAGSTDK